ncbi:DUF4158 domain-containing protein, partial [Acinetobacter baumannii]
MPAFEWVHVQLHQQKGMISLSPPTICNSALQLTTARFLGTFLPDLLQIPSFIRFYIAAQLNISRPEILSRYAERDNTRWEHQGLIKLYYDYHDFGDFPWSFRLKRLLYTRAWLSNERPGLLFDFAT